jgi:hypothetical protein
MDFRRLNDTLTVLGMVVGTVSTTILAIVPYLSGRPLVIASATIAALGALGGAFAAGFGRRALGTEYQEIANAKAIAVAAASIRPPPPASSAPNVPPP